MSEESRTVKLKGADKFITGNPTDVFSVSEGTVYVYVVKISGGKALRSMFLCERNAGEKIPSLSLKQNDNNDIWFIMLTARAEAKLDVISTSDDTEKLEKYRSDFIKELEVFKEPSEDRFSIRLVNWYEGKLSGERELIEKEKVEEKQLSKGRTLLLKSLFYNNQKFVYEGETESNLYNVMSIYCDYMKIKMCSYQTVTTAYGDDFTISDIARLSNFVIRNVHLDGKWYKGDMGALVVFEKDTDKALLCLPKSTGKYIIYDLVLERSYIVEEEEAAAISDNAYIAYCPLPSKSLTIRDVIKFAYERMNRADIRSIIFLQLLMTLVGLLIPILNQQIYDKLIPMGEHGALNQVGMVILTCMIGNIFFEMNKGLCTFRLSKQMEYTIVASTFDRIFRLPQNFIENFGSMELVNRVVAVTDTFSNVLSSGITAFVGFVLSILYLIKMFHQSSTLSWRAIIMVLITAVVMFAFGRVRVKYEKEKQENMAKSNGILYQYISGILNLKVTKGEMRALYEYEKRQVPFLESDKKSTIISNYASIFSTAATLFYSGFIFYTVVKKKQELTIGEYTAFNAAFGMFSSAVMQLVNFFLTVGMVIPVLDRVKPIYEQETEAVESATIVDRLEGEIELNHLYFSYGEGEEDVLKDISLNIKKGEFVGIVGSSGCGKSTLLKLLMGFEKPTKGKIYYDNKDIDYLDKRELRRQMGVVLQDGQLVVGTIFSNITIAAPHISPEEVEKLMDEVGMHEDIQSMPMGIFTIISEGGGTLSGGQKQRVLIARALANNPTMVLFDEATSALDNITQQKVCETLENRNMTRIMVAHRLSTVENCDRIIVMDAGKVVEEGNYKELIEKKGLFYELAKRQRVNV